MFSLPGFRLGILPSALLRRLSSLPLVSLPVQALQLFRLLLHPLQGVCSLVCRLHRLASAFAFLQALRRRGLSRLRCRLSCPAPLPALCFLLPLPAGRSGLLEPAPSPARQICSFSAFSLPIGGILCLRILCSLTLFLLSFPCDLSIPGFCSCACLFPGARGPIALFRMLRQVPCRLSCVQGLACLSPCCLRKERILLISRCSYSGRLRSCIRSVYVLCHAHLQVSFRRLVLPVRLLLPISPFLVCLSSCFNLLFVK